MSNKIEKEESSKKIEEEESEILNNAPINVDTNAVKTTQITLPKGSKFIVIFEHPSSSVAIQTGGFGNLDEMLGFNRRCVNPGIVEQMIIAYVNKQANQLPHE